jgi:hypothetical protein
VWQQELVDRLLFLNQQLLVRLLARPKSPIHWIPRKEECCFYSP